MKLYDGEPTPGSANALMQGIVSALEARNLEAEHAFWFLDVNGEPAWQALRKAITARKTECAKRIKNMGGVAAASSTAAAAPPPKQEAMAQLTHPGVTRCGSSKDDVNGLAHALGEVNDGLSEYGATLEEGVQWLYATFNNGTWIEWVDVGDGRFAEHERHEGLIEPRPKLEFPELWERPANKLNKQEALELVYAAGMTPTQGYTWGKLKALAKQAQHELRKRARAEFAEANPQPKVEEVPGQLQAAMGLSNDELPEGLRPGRGEPQDPPDEEDTRVPRFTHRYLGMTEHVPSGGAEKHTRRAQETLKRRVLAAGGDPAEIEFCGGGEDPLQEVFRGSDQSTTADW